MREENILELLKEVTDYYYHKTDDEWYNKISKQITRKLKKR